MPPACIFLSVAIEATDRPVVMEMICATRMIKRVIHKPACPVIQGKRRYMMTPRIVRMEGVNTPAKVPKRPLAFWRAELVLDVSGFIGIFLYGLLGAVRFDFEVVL